MSDSIEIIVTCPYCDKPLPDEINNIQIENTDELIGYTCSHCGNELTSEDIAIIDSRIESEYESFADKFVDDLIKDTDFKFK